MIPATTSPSARAQARPRRRERSRLLFLAVAAAVLLGIALGALVPDFARELRPLGTGFIALIRMTIVPVVFCTVALGVGSVQLSGAVGSIARFTVGYFLVISTLALAAGLVVGNLLPPGPDAVLTPALAERGREAAANAPDSTVDFLLDIIPDTLFSALTTETLLQTLLVALLVGFALRSLGSAGEPVLAGIGHLQRLVFRILAMIMWLAPVGALGAFAALVADTRFEVLRQLGVLLIAFYLTCAVFVFGLLGLTLRLVTGFSIFALLRYLAREYLLIASISSSEPALPRLMAKMEHLGVARGTVGVAVPTGYSFNLDGTAIYLTMASVFIAKVVGAPMGLPEQLSLLLFMIIASKGAAGVSGSGLATLAGGLAAHRPDLVEGVGLVIGIDRLMSEARALTNFSGIAVGTVLIGHWTRTLDHDQAQSVLDGHHGFDETRMVSPGGA